MTDIINQIKGSLTNEGGFDETKPYLQCDSDECDFVTNVADITQDLVGVQCPKCNANLLTQEDYDSYKTLSGVLNFAEEMTKELMQNPEIANEIQAVFGDLMDKEVKITATSVDGRPFIESDDEELNKATEQLLSNTELVGKINEMIDKKLKDD